MDNTPRTHPDFKHLIPPLTPDEYQQLEQNILSQGCRDPIKLWRGIIIDGHNRHEICTKHNLNYTTANLYFPTKDAAKLWILENQLGRRNISDAMRIELAAKKASLTGQTEHLTQALSRTTNLSERTIQRYMRIKTNGNPDLLQKVMSGQLKIGTAHRQLEAEVTITTVEPLTSEPLSTERQNFYHAQGIKGNIRHLNNVYTFLAHQSPGITDDDMKRMDRQFKLLGRLIK